MTAIEMGPRFQDVSGGLGASEAGETVQLVSSGPGAVAAGEALSVRVGGAGDTKPLGMAAPAYSARQIAGALGKTRQAVLMVLAGVPSEAGAAVAGARGPGARAWRFEGLPMILQAKLVHAAEVRGYRGAGALLMDCAGPARGLPEVLAAAPEVDREADLLHEDFRLWLVDSVKDRRALSAADRFLIWREACTHYEAVRVSSGEGFKAGALSRSLIDFLLKEVPGLVRAGARRPARSLARVFARHLQTFRVKGRGAVVDNRAARSGNYRPVLCPECWNKVVALGVAFQGNESLSWRKLKDSGQMCEGCQDRHKLDLRVNKSYVPASVRNAVTPLVAAAMPWRKSDAAGRAAGPKIPGDWSDIEPGDVFIADDVTWNHIVYGFEESGKLCFFRPECLYYMDSKSGYPLAWRLIRGHYTGRDIRLVTRDVLTRYGRPRLGFKYENGIWASRAARDETRGGEIDIRETEDGFKNLGMLVNIRHARSRNPTGKAVLEGEFHILQKLMVAERGYVGFNEREEKSDAIKRAQREAEAAHKAGDVKELGKRLNGFHSFESWGKRLEQLFDERANEVQNGQRNDGVSPKEHWQRGIARNPLAGFPQDVLYILDTHRHEVPINAQAITINYGKHEKWMYAGPELGRFINQRRVLASYHIDCPELLTVSDLKRTEHIVVKGNRLKSNTASAEEQATAGREIAEFNRTPRAIAGMLKHPIVNMITRDNEFVPEQREVGRMIAASKQGQAEEVEQAKEERRQRKDSARRVEPRRRLAGLVDSIYE